MKQAQRLYRLLGDVEDRYILETAQFPKKQAKTMIFKGLAVAACIAVLVGGGYGGYQRWAHVGGLSFSSVYMPSSSANATFSGTMTLLGTTLEELYDEADIVIIGTVTEHDRREYGSYGVNTCRAKIRVLSAYKGNAAAGDKLTVREIGKREENGEEYSLDGVPLLHEDMCVLLFLRAGTQSEDGAVVHSICGEYQGKFIFDTNGVLHESAEFGADSVTVIEDTETMDYKTVIKKLNAKQNADQ